ncbi:hypothetical protein H7J87_27920 [Mycolicibacterium wolinskyi]|uniref:Uncharacterized protein n=1 Tax=Mycolicibacterium wolinskyi TaxID=59750 RepID=A0A1X2FC25_9MYCO|nr:MULTISPECIES: hypothetical protein [Mycolicibacterium]MCV7289160.1 hypothetical protein [Mycolicibacterium wolinskyi]MCV7297321.1 hypothetical protein [Mycolicibacterium goodii]ORX15993.1 hypothetical protein AWC31_01075 [Mycolicibacterium wolinskyi]
MNTAQETGNGVDVRPFNSGAVTRVRYRGWIVDVDHAGTVTVPRQTVTGAAEDLAVCLDAARTISAKNVADAKAAAAAARAAKAAAAPQTAPHIVAAVPDRRPQVRPLIQVLQAARDIADHHWHPRRNDIYMCTKQAWLDHEMSVPFAWLQRALREALPPNATLTDYNDNSDHERAVGLFDTAISQLTRAPRPQPITVQAAS